MWLPYSASTTESVLVSPGGMMVSAMSGQRVNAAGRVTAGGIGADAGSQAASSAETATTVAAVRRSGHRWALAHRWPARDGLDEDRARPEIADVSREVAGEVVARADDGAVAERAADVEPVFLRLGCLVVGGGVVGHDVVVAGDRVARRDADAVAARGDVGAVGDRVAGDLVVVAAADVDAVLAGLVDHVAGDDVVVRLLVGLVGGGRRLDELDAVQAGVGDRAALDQVVAGGEELDAVAGHPVDHAVVHLVAQRRPVGVLAVEHNAAAARRRDLDPLDHHVVALVEVQGVAGAARRPAGRDGQVADGDVEGAGEVERLGVGGGAVV